MQPSFVFSFYFMISQQEVCLLYYDFTTTTYNQQTSSLRPLPFFAENLTNLAKYIKYEHKHNYLGVFETMRNVRGAGGSGDNEVQRRRNEC